MSRYYSDHRPHGYAYYAALYCGQCGHTLPDIDPEGNQKHPIASWKLNELNTDTQQTCATCERTINEWRPQ